MKIEEFVEKVRSELGKELGDGYKVEPKEVRKNNGVILHGLMVLEQGQNVAPTIYLDTFLEAYESGATFQSILNRLLDICREEASKKSIDMDFFRSFEDVRDRICYRLIGKERNEGLLEEIPYLDFLDLAICFYYAYHSDILGDGTILIYNSHMELWETCITELFVLAKRNTVRLFPWTYESLEEVLRRMAGQDAGLDGMTGHMPAGDAAEGSEQCQEDKRNVIHITKTVTFNEDGTMSIGSPKSEAGKRDIPLNDTIKEVLARQKKKLGNILPMNDGRVFTAVYGGTVHNNAINRAISDALSRLEEQGKTIEHFTANALRDTFATRYIEQGGSPQTLKTILGHSSLAMTMDLYSHVLPNTKQKEMDHLKIVL